MGLVGPGLGFLDWLAGSAVMLAVASYSFCAPDQRSAFNELEVGRSLREELRKLRKKRLSVCKNTALIHFVVDRSSWFGRWSEEERDI
jgi:hypothetical protein